MDNSHEMLEGNAYTMAIRYIKLEERVPKHKGGRGSPKTANWTTHQADCVIEGDRPAGQSKRRMNSASMSVVCRRLMTIEWMRALGRTIPASYAVTRGGSRNY